MVYNSTLGHANLREGTGKGRWVDGPLTDLGFNPDDLAQVINRLVNSGDDLAQVINRLVTSGDDIYVYWQGAHPSSLHGMPTLITG